MKTWITADLHLGENRFELMGRPFNDQQEMVLKLALEHNQLVNPDDLVIVNGDVCYQKTPEYLKYVSRFNGKKILIRGNHDRVFTDDELKPYFDEIIPEGSGRYYTVNDIKCYITHYPTCGVADAFNLVGHIHSAFKYQLNMLNIGIDVHNFKPVDMDKIPFHFKAICEFYDQDVWVAYNNVNSQFVGKRGKQTSYFTP